MKAFARTTAITVKEFKQLVRDRLTFGMVVMLPLIQLLLFGYAIRNEVRDVPAGLVDLAGSAGSRLLVESLRATQAVDFTVRYESPEAGETGITRGEVRAVLVIPQDVERRLEERNPVHGAAGQSVRPVAQWMVDGSDPLIANTILGLGNMPVAEITGNAEPRVPSFESVLYFNPEQRTEVNIVPGLLAVILTMTMILFTATAIVRERERGNLELLITTPVLPFELMLGKILPYIAIGLIQTCIILGLGYLVFSVPIRGALHQIVFATLIFIAANLSLGLLISTTAKTQLQAMQMTIFVLLPSILLSGFMFPFEGMPRPAQWIAEVLPATHFVRIVRAVVLRGATLSELGSDALFLGVFAVAGLLVASLRFRKRLD